MLKSLNHVAIAVPDLQAAIDFYQNQMGLHVSDPKDLPEHGVTVSVARLPNMVIELLHPLGDNSPIAKFLERNPKGGMHHMSFDVDNVEEARDDLVAQGVEIIGDGEPKIGFHGTPVIFLKPQNGVLIELQELRRVTEDMSAQDEHEPLPSSRPPQKTEDGLESVSCTFDAEVGDE